MYKFIEYNVTRGRERFPRILKDVAGADGDLDDVIVSVSMRGKPQAVIISWKNFNELIEWKFQQARDRGGWREEARLYAQLYLGTDASPELVLERLMKKYGPDDLTIEEAEEIVRVALEEGRSRSEAAAE